MITIDQVQKLRELHDKEKQAYFETFNSGSMEVYGEWVKVCDELNKFISTIVAE